MIRLVAVAAASALLSACATARPPGGSGDGASDAVVAEVDGTQITLAELDRSIASELHDLRAEGLEELIEQRALEREAARRGVTVDALVAAETATLPPIGDEDVARFFRANERRIPAGETLETIGPQIRDALEEARAREAVDRLLAGLEVAVYLAPPRIDVDATGPSLGPADAPVTIVAWIDYECPYCARAEPVLRALRERYPDDVRVVHRHMPLSFHPQARPAAIAAVCAEEQDRFFDYHDALFANQGDLSPALFGQLADELALDRAAFDACRASDAAADRVDRDFHAAERAGATGTPAFNLNGIQWSGARPIEAFVELVEQELSRAEDGGA